MKIERKESVASNAMKPNQRAKDARRRGANVMAMNCQKVPVKWLDDKTLVLSMRLSI